MGQQPELPPAGARGTDGKIQVSPALPRLSNETRERRAASWLVGMARAMMLCRHRPQDWSDELHEQFVAAIPVADDLHKEGKTYLGPIAVAKMAGLAEKLGFSESLSVF